jgi:hypothetical protein
MTFERNVWKTNMFSKILDIRENLPKNAIFLENFRENFAFRENQKANVVSTLVSTLKIELNLL